MSEYLHFEPRTYPGRRTPVVYVRAKRTGDKLGEIKWFGRWRQFCFFPSYGTVFNTGCMTDIQDKIKELHEERASGRAK